uniref:EGF-like domain-containing protein n=1 Tax=Callorhinchus milii TaxID=7868 RepID=A0A4W3JEC7_CALMI|eukprot:gi/632949451/ref/XP_007890164.1/ PREDICTED: proepiregulin [Callorhinchus milii]
MSSSRRFNLCTAFLVTIELCLFHNGESATTSPLCVPGQECNSLDPTVELPEAAKVVVSKCPLSMESYCYNGECMHIVSDNISFCKCDKGYFGNRCMHIELVRQPLSEEDVALAVAVSFMVLIGVLVATWLIYIRCKKSRSKNQPEYTGVQTTTTTTNCV